VLETMTVFPLRREITRGAISLIAGIVLWEVLAHALRENEPLDPPPSSVAGTFWHLLTSTDLISHRYRSSFKASALPACLASCSVLMGIENKKIIRRKQIV